MNSYEDNESTSGDMQDLVRLAGKGEVLPIISHSFRVEEIFQDDEELFKLMLDVPQYYDEFRTFDQQLTKKWADYVNYPMSDDHNLARVAQFMQVEASSSKLRDNYLQFIIERLLTIAEKSKYYKTEEEYRNAVNGYRKLLKTQIPLFTDVANQLGFPQVAAGFEDPLRLLARLPIKIYLTTSFSNFLEAALEKEDKFPHTHLCFCKKDLITDPRHLPDRDFIPSVKEPAVVHLFGLEDYTKTLVLSEDDHINFLMNAVEYMKSDAMFPSYLRGALSDPEESLLLIGYHSRDWEFRTLFRFLALVRNISDIDSTSMAIQFKPSLGSKKNQERSLKYLEKYFNKVKFNVLWKSTEEFIYTFYEECKPIMEGES